MYGGDVACGFFCVILRWSVCVCRWSFLLGVQAVRSLLFRQILNSISRSECKNGPIKGSATHAMRSCACALFRHMQLPMMHPLVGPFQMWLRAGQWIGGQCFTGFGGNDWG